MSYLEKLLNGVEVEWKTLGEVCDFQNGFAFQSNLFKDSGLPIVRITNINGVNVDLSDVKYFSPDDYNSGNPLNYAIVKGDILIAMSGATTGKIGYYNLDEKAYLNQRVGKFIPNKELLNNRFCIADNFWTMVTGDFMYSIGGVAGARNPNNAECFTAQPASLYENGFAAGGQNETCATYNMLKLTSGLFMFDQRAELMDYYERGLYNHILASVAEHSPANTYHVPLRPGSVKQFGNPHMNGFTCCNGTAIESSTKLQNSIYFKSTDNKTLYINLYVASTLQWKERKITITQSTAYPNEDQTKLTVQGKGKFELKVRVPHWASIARVLLKCTHSLI